MLILAINPGSTSTKVALYTSEGEKLIQKAIKTIRHEVGTLPEDLFEQLPERARLVEEFLKENGVALEDIDVFVGRGGPVIPLESGTYVVDDNMVKVLKEKYTAYHPSLLGGLIARRLADKVGKRAYIADPVSVDEMWDWARFSGLKEIERKSLAHALNIKAVIRRFCKEKGLSYENLKLVVAHLGGGISVTAHVGGKMVDVNNANDEGPFSPERTGTLPVTQIVKLCYSGKYTEKEMLTLITKRGGLVSYLGTNDGKKIGEEIKRGNEEWKLVYEAMCYQISKEIGAMAAAAGGVDYIIITGGLAQDKFVIDFIRNRCGWIAPIEVYPGEDELLALAEAGFIAESTGKYKRVEV